MGNNPSSSAPLGPLKPVRPTGRGHWGRRPVATEEVIGTRCSAPPARRWNAVGRRDETEVTSAEQGGEAMKRALLVVLAATMGFSTMGVAIARTVATPEVDPAG